MIGLVVHGHLSLVSGLQDDFQRGRGDVLRDVGIRLHIEEGSDGLLSRRASFCDA